MVFLCLVGVVNIQTPYCELGVIFIWEWGLGWANPEAQAQAECVHKKGWGKEGGGGALVTVLQILTEISIKSCHTRSFTKPKGSSSCLLSVFEHSRNSALVSVSLERGFGAWTEQLAVLVGHEMFLPNILIYF